MIEFADPYEFVGMAIMGSVFEIQVFDVSIKYIVLHHVTFVIKYNRNRVCLMKLEQNLIK